MPKLYVSSRQRVLRWQSDSCDRQHSRPARCAMCTRWSCIACYDACCTRIHTTQSRASVHVRRTCAVCDPPRKCADRADWFVEWKEFAYVFLIHSSNWHYWGVNTSEHDFPRVFRRKIWLVLKWNFMAYQIQFQFLQKGNTFSFATYLRELIGRGFSNDNASSREYSGLRLSRLRLSRHSAYLD